VIRCFLNEAFEILRLRSTMNILSDEELKGQKEFEEFISSMNLEDWIKFIVCLFLIGPLMIIITACISGAKPW
jgi:hypothetical protein